MVTEQITGADDIAFDEPEAGIYEAVFMGLELKPVTDEGTGESKTLWVWKFQVSDTVKLDTLTSATFASGSNALKLFTGILGHPPAKGDKPNEHIGTKVSVVYGPNRAGKLTVTDALPVKK
jgi:hypothetical protein